MEDPQKATTPYIPETNLTPGGDNAGHDLIINDDSKFEIDEKRLLYSLSLEHDNSGNSVEAEALGRGFRRVNDRHVTILGGETKRLLKNVLDQFTEQERMEILKEIRKILGSLKWNFVPQAIYRVQKQDYFGGSEILENRESYINIIAMPDMEVFYRKLNVLLKSDLPTHVAHITLFSKGEAENPRYYGIPISTIADFHQMKPEQFLDSAL